MYEKYHNETSNDIHPFCVHVRVHVRVCVCLYVCKDQRLILRVFLIHSLPWFYLRQVLSLNLDFMHLAKLVSGQ